MMAPKPKSLLWGFLILIGFAVEFIWFFNFESIIYDVYYEARYKYPPDYNSTAGTAAIWGDGTYQIKTYCVIWGYRLVCFNPHEKILIKYIANWRVEGNKVYILERNDSKCYILDYKKKNLDYVGKLQESIKGYNIYKRLKASYKRVEKEHSFFFWEAEQKGGIISNKEAALKLARMFWLTYYDKDSLKKYKPYTAVPEGDTWVIRGKDIWHQDPFTKSRGWFDKAPLMVINRYDARVIKVR